MGYVTGTGLGKDPSSSRVLPVTATIYPQGKSLDWCMELRERAGGGDILSVEKTLRRQQAKEEKKMERRMVREKEREKRQNREGSQSVEFGMGLRLDFIKFHLICS